MQQVARLNATLIYSNSLSGQAKSLCRTLCSMFGVFTSYLIMSMSSSRKLFVLRLDNEDVFCKQFLFIFLGVFIRPSSGFRPNKSATSSVCAQFFLRISLCQFVNFIFANNFNEFWLY